MIIQVGLQWSWWWHWVPKQGQQLPSKMMIFKFMLSPGPGFSLSVSSRTWTWIVTITLNVTVPVTTYGQLLIDSGPEPAQPIRRQLSKAIHVFASKTAYSTKYISRYKSLRLTNTMKNDRERSISICWEANRSWPNLSAILPFDIRIWLKSIQSVSMIRYLPFL